MDYINRNSVKFIRRTNKCMFHTGAEHFKCSQTLITIQTKAHSYCKLFQPQLQTMFNLLCLNVLSIASILLETAFHNSNAANQEDRPSNALLKVESGFFSPLTLAFLRRRSLGLSRNLSPTWRAQRASDTGPEKFHSDDVPLQRCDWLLRVSKFSRASNSQSETYIFQQNLRLLFRRRRIVCKATEHSRTANVMLNSQYSKVGSLKFKHCNNGNASSDPTTKLASVWCCVPLGDSLLTLPSLRARQVSVLEHQENELLVKLSTVSFSEDLVQGTESSEGLRGLSCGRCRMLASFWVCSLTHSKISRPCWVRNWKCPSPVLQPLKIEVNSDMLCRNSVKMVTKKCENTVCTYNNLEKHTQ